MTDPIADMLTQIRNAQAAEKETVNLSFSQIKMALARIMLKQKTILGLEQKGRGPKRRIEITLGYKDDKKSQPIINELKRISRPGKRQYLKTNEIRPVLGGRGFTIISTSAGLMTNLEAKKKGLGGEILCQIW